MRMLINGTGTIITHYHEHKYLSVEKKEKGAVEISRDYFHITVYQQEIDSLIFALEQMKHAECNKPVSIEVAGTSEIVNPDDDIPF